MDLPPQLTRADLLRLGEEQIESLLRELNKRIPSEAEQTLRRHDRYPYRVPEGLVVLFDRAGSRPQRFVVRPRNISAGGIAFLHGAFVYPGTGCRILLKTLRAQYVLMAGTVVQVRCVRGRAHEIKMKFAAEVNVENFVAVSSCQTADRGMQEYCVEEVIAGVEELLEAARQAASAGTIRFLLHRIEEMLARG